MKYNRILLVSILVLLLVNCNTVVITKDILFFNSYNQIDYQPVNYMISRSDDNSTVMVNVIVETSDGLEKDYIFSLYINGDLFPIYPKRGSFSLKVNTMIDSLFFVVDKDPLTFYGMESSQYYHNVRTEVLMPHALMGDTLTIHIPIVDSLFKYRVFENQRLKLRKRKMFFPHEKNIDNLHLQKEVISR